MKRFCLLLLGLALLVGLLSAAHADGYPGAQAVYTSPAGANPGWDFQSVGDGYYVKVAHVNGTTINDGWYWKKYRKWNKWYYKKTHRIPESQIQYVQQHCQQNYRPQCPPSTVNNYLGASAYPPPKTTTQVLSEYLSAYSNDTTVRRQQVKAISDNLLQITREINANEQTLQAMQDARVEALQQTALIGEIVVQALEANGAGRLKLPPGQQQTGGDFYGALRTADHQTRAAAAQQVFATRCFACHHPQHDVKAGLDLSNVATLTDQQWDKIFKRTRLPEDDPKHMPKDAESLTDGELAALNAFFWCVPRE